MKTLQIKTAQNVNISFTLASVFQRLLAFILDNVVKLAYLYFGTLVFDFNLFQEGVGTDA